MSGFPRTTIENLSVSRLMMGTNWFMGYSHSSKAKDRLILDTMSAERIADTMVAFMNHGVDTLYGMSPDPKIVEAVERAQDRAGKRCIIISIPTLPLDDPIQCRGEAERILDEYAAIGTDICMPHQCTTDAFVNRRTQRLDGIEVYLQMIRDRNMLPGLSTHMPETPIYADASGLDVATYIQIYNAAGFLMQIEIDWVQRMIWNAKKPVITIKPLAAGKLPPLVGLAFSWSTLRDIDMVCIGTSSPDEAEEAVEISMSIFERRVPDMDLQETRSKASMR